ncbi:transcription factor jun-D [Lates japonicus]|uniref:Transcription factor jun-D n=1 Tax=Lates japonicus TaxID=270547 RepID=A0AAD3MB54_LATJO|nr:transcription factor jun-D [Lates japonicus]
MSNPLGIRTDSPTPWDSAELTSRTWSLIIQSNGLVTTTTSTATARPPGSSARGVCQRRAGVRRGFVKALEDLHKAEPAGRSEPLRSHHHQLLHGHHPFPPPRLIWPSARQQAAAAAAPLCITTPVRRRGETSPRQYQTCRVSEGPSVSIDMDNQERIKAERKKLRNRIAASKCRREKTGEDLGWRTRSRP